MRKPGVPTRIAVPLVLKPAMKLKPSRSLLSSE